MEKKYLIAGAVIVAVLLVCGLLSALSFFGIKNASFNIQSQSCDLLADKKAADDCYYGLAASSGDSSYCTKIENQTRKAECMGGQS